MATAPIIEEPPVANDEAEKPDLIALVEQDRAAVLTGKVDPDAYVAALRASVQAKGLTPDTKNGLDQIKSEAHEIRRKKAAIDNHGKAMTEGWRKQTAVVNAARNVITEKMDALIDEVRAPVTAWEQAEESRKAEADRMIADLQSAGIVTIGMTADDVEQRLDRIRGINLNGDVLGVRIEMATDMQRDAVAALTQTLADIRAQEAEAAELEQLRRERAEAERRAEQEAAERLAKERAEQAAKDEAERIARAAQEAADRARREAEQAAEQARRDAEEAAERKRQEEAAAAQQVEDRRNYARQVVDQIKMVGLGMIGGQTYPYPILIRELEEKIAIDESLGDMQEEVRAIRDLTLQNVKDAQQRQVERRAAEDAEADRKAKEQARADAAAAVEAERLRREADQAHRQQVIQTAADSLVGIPGLTKKLATTIIQEIAAGSVPAVSIKF